MLAMWMVLCGLLLVGGGCKAWRVLGGSPLLEAAAKGAIRARVPEWLEDAGLPPDVISPDEADWLVDQIASSLASNALLDAYAVNLLSNATVAAWAEARIGELLSPPEKPAETDPGLPLPDEAGGWPMPVARWLGLAAPDAVRDPRVELAVSADGTLWTLTVDGVAAPSDGPAHWSMGNPSIARALCGMWQPLSDGQWIGGKYEWFRPRRSWENVRNGYAGHRTPEKGTPIKVAVYSPDARWRSNVVDLTW